MNDPVPKLADAPRVAVPPASVNPDSSLRMVVAHRRGRHRMILIEEIRRIESAGNYVRVHIEGGAYLVRSTMQWLEDRLACQGFVRVHRGALVPVHQMLEIIGAQGSAHRLTLRDGSSVRVSREIWQRLRRQPGILLSPQLADSD
jgi:DNA-binding LytR/AlgR family response regulator